MFARLLVVTFALLIFAGSAYTVHAADDAHEAGKNDSGLEAGDVSVERAAGVLPQGEDGQPTESCNGGSLPPASAGSGLSDRSVLMAAGPPVVNPGKKNQQKKVRRVPPRPAVEGAILRGNRAIPKEGYEIVTRPGNRAVLMRGTVAVGEIECHCTEAKGTCKKNPKKGELLCQKVSCSGECYSWLNPFSKGAVGPGPGGLIAK